MDVLKCIVQVETFAVQTRRTAMELNEILNDMQSSLDDFQKKLNELRAVRTGSLYEVDVLVTRKEAAYFIGRSTRQLDRLCSEHKIRREYVNGAVRIRRSALLKYLGQEVRPVTPGGDREDRLSEFERIMSKYNR